MNANEIVVFLEAVKALQVEFENYDDFDVLVEADKWHPGEGNYHVVVTYGEVQAEWVTCGYNFAYNMKRLFNNEALNKMLR